MNRSVDATIEKHSQTAPVNVEQIIRDLGIELDKKAELDPEVSGQLERLEDGLYKVSTNKAEHYFRQRFSMAHELGHYLLHLDLVGDGVDDTKMYRSELKGNFHNSKISRAHETEANKFAAKLLTPKHLVDALWETDQNVKSLAAKFQISVRAMEIRLSDLELNN